MKKHVFIAESVTEILNSRTIHGKVARLESQQTPPPPKACMGRIHGCFPSPRIPRLEGGKLEIFPCPKTFIYREKAVYDDSHLVSLGASLFQVPEPVWGGGGSVNFHVFLHFIFST